MEIKFNKRQRRLIKKFLAPFQGRAKVDLMKVFKGYAYLVRTGCQWKMIPRYFPAPTTIYYHFRQWCESTAPALFLQRLNRLRRRRMGKSPTPTVGVVDSESVRSRCAQSQKGIDGFKRVKGIKRQLLVDSNGYPLTVDVTTANIHDSKGVATLLKDTKLFYPTISLVKADMGYRGVDGSLTECVIECKKSNFGTAQFRQISGRWVVERTNSWLNNYRRLCCNYEKYLMCARTMAYMASILFMLHYF